MHWEASSVCSRLNLCELQIIVKYIILVIVKACSHCRDRQDKTVLSCLQLCSHRRRGVGGVNKLLVANLKMGRDETKLIETGSRQDKTVLSAVRTQLATRRQFVSSASAVWTNHNVAWANYNIVILTTVTYLASINVMTYLLTAYDSAVYDTSWHKFRDIDS